jgi:NodT family efflux transporter outer membrane factor (OMF) lipoprotein
MIRRRRAYGSPLAGLALPAALLAGCVTVGPDFETPDAVVAEDWHQPRAGGLASDGDVEVAWWRLFGDPVLDELIVTAQRQNNTLQIAALRVLEARAQLGVATGLRYPQSQIASGNLTWIGPPDDAPISVTGAQASLGAAVAWELDFWGRFRRGIESADAAFLASVAAYDQAMVLLVASVADVYTRLRTTEEQLRIARDNVAIQQRSYEITRVRFQEGADSELDVQQAKTLLLSTRATIPALEASLAQLGNALSALLGRPPGAVEGLLARGNGLPAVPDRLSVAVPAELLRRRPDVREAELLATAQNALVGLAESDLYPRFSLNGAIGVSAGGIGDPDFGDMFDAEAITTTAGASFVWPFLNYGRIRNNVRVQDARLQQSLVNYVETVLQAAREVEDAMAAFIGSRREQEILAASVAAAKRSNELSTLRYAEGFSDYERVLNAQQALFAQQQRYVSNQGEMIRSVIALYRALGGGWETREGLPEIDPDTLERMRERTNWGRLIE